MRGLARIKHDLDAWRPGIRWLDDRLTSLGYPTQRSVALALDEDEGLVSHVFRGRAGIPQQTERIRDGLARLADVPRRQIDAWLDDPRNGEVLR